MNCQQLYAKLVLDDTIEAKMKPAIVDVFSECDKRLIDGADEHLLMLDMVLRLAGILAQK